MWTSAEQGESLALVGLGRQASLDPTTIDRTKVESSGSKLGEPHHRRAEFSLSRVRRGLASLTIVEMILEY
jgi:hypothetical protein